MSNKQPDIRFKGFIGVWEEATLGGIGQNFDYGLNAAAKKYDGQNKYLRITDIDDITHQFKTENLTSPNSNLENKDSYLLEENDIVFARTGASVGKTYKYKKNDGKVYFAGYLIRMGVLPSYSSSFIFYQTLTNEYKRFVKIVSQRSGQPGINSKEYQSYTINFTSKEEQNKIACLLENIDTLINLESQNLTKLKQFKQSMLQKLFPRDGQTEPEVRFSGFSGEWQKVTLGELGHTYNGLSGKTKDDFGKGNAKYVTYMNVFKNTLATNTGTELVEIDKSQNIVQYGDVFFTVSSETPYEVGMSSVWLFDERNIYLNSFCFGYRFGVKVNLYFSAYMLRSPMIREQFTLLAQGISRFNISKRKAMDINIFRPTLAEQEAIGLFFNNLEQRIDSQQQKLTKIKQFKQSLLQKMFV